MPKPLRPCAQAGCPTLVAGGYCTAHQRGTRRRHDAERGSAAARGYGRRWREASHAYLKKHPLCECDECSGPGCETAAEVVDHIIPHRGDMRLFWDRSNWQAMSKRCHDRKTVREDGGFGR